MNRDQRTWQPSLRIVAAYVVFLTLWILGSDAVVAALARDAFELARYQTAKGIGFVVVSAALLYLLIHRTIDSIRRTEEQIAQSEGPLSLALSQLPANIWTTDTELRITSIRGMPNPNQPSTDRAELIGKTIAEVTGSDDPSAPPVRAHREALAGREARFRYQRGDMTLDNTVGPLRDLGDRIIGCLGFVLDVTDGVRSEQDRTAALKHLQRVNEEREVLLRHLVQAEEEERKRIAAGIHDDSIQVMTSAGMALDLLINRLETGEDAELAVRARSLISDAIARLRRLVFELRPMELDEAGLAPAVRLLLKKASVESGFEFSLVDESRRAVEPEKIHVVYQIVQESITNIRKHADAQHVTVELREIDGELSISVSDDGRGFEPEAASRQHHFGMSDMRERAHAIGGTCTIRSAPGSGAVVEILVPLEERPLQRTAVE